MEGDVLHNLEHSNLVGYVQFIPNWCYNDRAEG